jgi:hypothetical protein
MRAAQTAYNADKWRSKEGGVEVIEEKIPAQSQLVSEKKLADLNSYNGATENGMLCVADFPQKASAPHTMRFPGFMSNLNRSHRAAV